MKNTSTKNGYTLMEILVTIGIVAMVALAAATGIQLMNQLNADNVNRSDINYFAKNLSHFLKNQNNCNIQLLGKTLPALTTPAAITINNFTAGGLKAPNTTVAAGALINSSVTLKSITWQNKGDVQADYTTSGANFTQNRRTAQFNLTFTVTSGGGNTIQKIRTFDLPVLVDGTNKVSACFSEFTTQQFCTLVNKTYDSITQTCSESPTGACDSYGTYTITKLQQPNGGGGAQTTIPPSLNTLNQISSKYSCPVVLNSQNVNIVSDQAPGFQASSVTSYYTCVRPSPPACPGGYTLKCTRKYSWRKWTTVCTCTGKILYPGTCATCTYPVTSTTCTKPQYSCNKVKSGRTYYVPCTRYGGRCITGTTNVAGTCTPFTQATWIEYHACAACAP